MDAVTEVLLDRSRDAQHFSRMVVVSLLLHGALLTAIVVLPHVLARAQEPKSVMMITLGGAPGPYQGRLAISAKQVQQVTPDTSKPKQDTPPAMTKPEMVEALKNTKPIAKTPPKPEPKKETAQLHGRTPTQGAEIKPGMARVDTKGAAVPFGGLATGGGGGGSATTDVKDFCCPDYLIAVTNQVRRNWQQNQGQDGSAIISFTINRDGSITNVVAEQGANPILTMASQRAIVATQRVAPLPAAYTNDHLTVHLAFQYQR
ncbi:MAG TPA: TonB C-terminal domain-containing protein [Vicinamibacterales bacterium]